MTTAAIVVAATALVLLATGYAVTALLLDNDTLETPSTRHPDATEQA